MKHDNHPKGANGQIPVRCAIYTRKSTNENLDSDFNSLDAQREACELYIQSQTREGWIALDERYDDGAYSGATMDRPAVKRLLADVEADRIDVIVVYRIDRLSRNLLDFTQTQHFLEQHGCSFVSVSEQFNTKTPMGRFAMHVVSSFSEMEREVIAERIRDKVAASKRRGKWMGGTPPLGYDVDRRRKRLVVNKEEAALVRFIFRRYLQFRSVMALINELNEKGLTTKSWTTKSGAKRKGRSWNKSHIHRLLNNPVYIGKVRHKEATYPGEHEAIIENSLWDEVHRTIKSEGRNPSGRSHTHALLKGIIRCGHCKTSMGVTFTKKGDKRYRYYLCHNANKNGYAACPIRTAPAGDIENLVLIQIRRILSSPEIVAETFRQVEELERHEREEQDARKNALREELTTIRAAAERMRDTENHTDLIGEELGALEGKIGKLTRELEAIETETAYYRQYPLSEKELGDELARLNRLWDELFPAERARIVHMLVDEITISENGVDLILHDNGIAGLVLEMKGEHEHVDHH